MLEVKEQFYLDGKPFKIISGSIHYFRVVPEYWQDRLEKLKNMGCNTVETYIPWNFHESKKGEFNWEGIRNVFHFIELAQKLGLYVIIRPSPYICAEWEFGGLPSWLLKDRNMRLRCSYPPYLQAVKEYYTELIPRLLPYQMDRGGPIILMQLENEYGYYGNDTSYMEFLRDTVRSMGVTVPLVTSDGPWNEGCFKSGMVDGALCTGNFGSEAPVQFERMKAYTGKNGPSMCMEFWIGWFDAWGEQHHTNDPEKAAKELEDMIERGSLNIYMFQGGTNFGFMAGRNAGSKNADVTSYDYDSILTEDGQITRKYELFQKIIAKYNPVEQIPLSTKIRRASFGKVKCSAKTGLFENLEALASPVKSLYPLTMEDIDQNYGFILYRTEARPYETVNDIKLEGAADRANVYQNGRFLFTAVDTSLNDKFEVQDKCTAGRYDILIENYGRENFGGGLELQRKGLSGGLRLNDHRHFGFDIYALPLDCGQMNKLDFAKGYDESSKAPAFYKFDFDVDEPGDTFLDTERFGKGAAFVNGFNLGRYWEIGPQKRLYVPAPLLHKGKNSIILFETEGKAGDSITLCDEPSL